MAFFGTHGTFPSVAYRGFAELEHLELFLRGEIRFGLLSHYRQIECETRHDPTEGIGHYRFMGADHHSIFASNAIYVLCFSRTESGARRFGPHIARTEHPRRLAEVITAQLPQTGLTFYGGVEGVPVEYSKGGALESAPDAYHIARFAYSQKPESFLADEEFRFVLVRKGAGYRASDSPYMTLRVDSALADAFSSPLLGSPPARDPPHSSRESADASVPK
jgi:hypothetical protein